MQLVYGFMGWKSVTAFVMSSELVEPDCVISVAVDRNDVLIACRPIVRKPLSVGPVQWLPKEAVGDEVVALLPQGQVKLDADTESALMRAFGSGGEFERGETEKTKQRCGTAANGGSRTRLRSLVLVSYPVCSLAP